MVTAQAGGAVVAAGVFGDVVGVATAVSVVAVVAVWAMARLLPRSPGVRRSGVLLGEATTRDVGYVAALPRAELVGAEGVALTDLRPSGTAQIGEERIDVVAEGSWITAGSRVRIVSSEGYRHVVRPVPGS